MNIEEAVKHHHQLVENKGYTVIMTSLIGSQNYNLADEHSDIDTFSLVMPSIEDLAVARDPVAGEFEVEDGKCMYKDIRVALNLLKKTSPNSIEMFISKYKYFNSKYKDILSHYFSDKKKCNIMIHCNYSHMLYACAGMAHQLTKRNMPAGKRYAHALRLTELVQNFLNYSEIDQLLILSDHLQEEAMRAKRDTTNNDDYYNQKCEEIATQLDVDKANFISTPAITLAETAGCNLINKLQLNLMKRYLGVK